MGKALAGRPPGIKKFASERSRCFNFGEHALLAEDKGGTAVAALLFHAAFWRTEAAIRHRHRGISVTAIGGVGSLQQSGESGAGRTGQIRCAHFERQARRRTYDRRVELLAVGRRGGGEKKRAEICGRSAFERVAQSLRRHRNAVLVEARDRAFAAGGGNPEDRRYRGALEPTV